jgi:protein-disulfide isomerase
MKLGPDNSTLVIVEFSDMQCPFCRKFWYQSLSKIKTEYIESGKVQFVFRHLPLDVHPMAQKSAEALLCAKEQNKEWEMHDKIYLEQIKIGALGTVRYGSYELLKWANETGLEMTSFQMCLSSGRYTNEVDFDKQYAKKLGFNATPSFIIAKRDGSNIVPIVGTQMYATYNATINELLK